MTDVIKNKRFELSLVHDQLKAKLYSLQELSKNQQSHFDRKFQDEKTKSKKKIQKSFHALSKTSEKLTRLYDKERLLKKDTVAPFFYQQQIEDLFLEEESFTSALTAYTRKQFFEGIGDLAGAKDESKYDILDVSKPETLLIKGESEEIKSRDRDELQRLQSQYRKSEETRIKNGMSMVGLKKAVETAERQLQKLSRGKLDMSYDQLQRGYQKLSEDIEDKKKELLYFYENELTPILVELEGLHGTKVLRGNYDLKIARQDYFVSKQNEVINQLLLQCSRDYFVSMMYEIELKSHRNAYHLLASARSLLENEVKNIENRITSLSDPVLLSNAAAKETISSRDSFGCRLHESLVKLSHDDDREELYKTYDTVVDQAKILSSRLHENEREIQEALDQKLQRVQTLASKLKESQNIVENKQDGVHIELTKLVEDLEEQLAMTEVQVNEIIKDVMTKKRLLATDSLIELERTIFPNFFNDPERLRRTIQELESRVKTCTT